jgi:hypothetical protein
MTQDDEHTLVFRSVSGVSVREAGETVSIEFATSSGQTIRVNIPAEVSHTLSRMLMRAQIEAAAERGMPKDEKDRPSTSSLPQASGPAHSEDSARIAHEDLTGDADRVQS